MTHRTWLPALLAALLVAVPGVPGTARAQTDGAPPVDVDVDEGSENTGTPRPAAVDQRSMHLLIHAKAGFSAPAGSIAEDLPFSEVAGIGPSFGGSLGLGLSRYLVLEASASYALLSAQDTCAECTKRSSSFEIGLGFAYHLAQGFAFDPWLSYGVGFRTATLSGARIRSSTGVGDIADGSFQGLDFARIGLGGDFYPLPALGLGAYFEAALGTSIRRPEPEIGSSVYGFFSFGLRVALDPMRRAPSVSGTAAARLERAR